MKELFRNFIAPFDFLTQEEKETIVEHTVLKAFDKGTVLLRAGEVSKSCYAVMKGCVREYLIKDGVERTIAFYTEGQPVNSFSSSSKQKPSMHYLECSEDCVLTVGNDSLIDEICERIPRLTQFLKREVEKDAGELQERMAKFMTSSPEERFENIQANNPELLNRVPQHQIASYLGVTPESLSRIKKRVQAKK
jgi:CRP-like cAMP-binding protein